MIKERYVNLEVAKLLRDKGFNEKCFRLYNISNGLIFEGYNICNSELNKTNEQITVPTQQMACDWIEEIFNISIEVYANIIGYTVCLCYALQDHSIASDIIEDDIPSGDNIDGSWSSKELAYNEALKYVLTELV